MYLDSHVFTGAMRVVLILPNTRFGDKDQINQHTLPQATDIFINFISLKLGSTLRFDVS